MTYHDCRKCVYVHVPPAEEPCSSCRDYDYDDTSGPRGGKDYYQPVMDSSTAVCPGCDQSTPHIDFIIPGQYPLITIAEEKPVITMSREGLIKFISSTLDILNQLLDALEDSEEEDEEDEGGEYPEDEDCPFDPDSEPDGDDPLYIFQALATDLGNLVSEKNKAYGDSFAKSGDFLRLLYPAGIDPKQFEDMLGLVRIFDKQMRIATQHSAFGESPWRDIAGYGLLGLKHSIDKGVKTDDHG